MTAATTLCGLQGVGRRCHHRFNQEGREAEGGQRSRATRIKGVEEKALVHFYLLDGHLTSLQLELKLR